MVAPGTWFAIAINTGVALAALVLLFRYRDRVSGSTKWLNDGNHHPDWYESAAALAAEVSDAVDYGTAPADHDRIQRAVLPLSNRIEGHLREAPADVDEVILRRLYELSRDCRSVAFRRADTLDVSVFLEDELDQLAERAEGIEGDVMERIEE